MSVKTRMMVMMFSIALFGAMLTVAVSAQQPPTGIDYANDSVVTVLVAGEGGAEAVGSGLIVRTDGYILTPYSLVRGVREIQVRLRSGETYDNAELVAKDERRNVAVLRIHALGLHNIPHLALEETQVGSRVFAMSNLTGLVIVKAVTLDSVQMADRIPGAGSGYRILQFDGSVGGESIGGLLLDEGGRSLGMITTTPEVMGQGIAVPLSSVIGMIRSVPATNVPAPLKTATYPAASQTPVPIPQGSVLVPQRGVTPLSPKGPGSVVVKPSSVPEILAASKTIYVTTNTVFFKPEQLVSALNERKEMSEWGLSFVNEPGLADLILDIDHVVFTYKFTFRIYSQRLGTVVATGSRIIWDGNLGAPYMADRVVEKLKAARGTQQPVPNAKPAASPDPKSAPSEKS